MRVSEIMSTKVLSITPDVDTKRAVSLMRRNNFKELPVVEKDKVVGLVTMHDLALSPSYYGSEVPVKSIMFMPPLLRPNDDVVEALRLMSETGVSGLPVFNKSLVGFITDHDLLKFYLDEFKTLILSDLMKSVPVLESDEPAGKAIRLMNFHKISSMPVTSKGDLVGVVNHDDLLESFYLPSEGETKGEVGGAAKHPLSSPLYGLLRKDYKTVMTDDLLSKAVQLMLKNHLISVIVVNSVNKPVGLIDRKELITYLHNKLTGWDTFIHFSGLKLDYLTKQLLTKIIINHLDRINYLVTDLNNFKVYLKGIHDHAGVHNYEVKLTITQKGRALNIKKNGYSLRETLDDALSDLERMLDKNFKKR